MNESRLHFNAKFYAPAYTKTTVFTPHLLSKPCTYLKYIGSSLPDTGLRLKFKAPNYFSSLAKMAYIHCKIIDTFTFTRTSNLGVKLSNDRPNRLSRNDF